MKRVAELLSPEERASLQADLAELARLRRKAEADSANVVIVNTFVAGYEAGIAWATDPEQQRERP